MAQSFASCLLAFMYISLPLLPVITNFFVFLESSGNLISFPRVIEFGVNTEYSKSSSIYVHGRLLRLTSTFNNPSSHSDNVNNDLPMDLYRLCFVTSIKRSYCPPDHGARER